jgi:poly(hydroxyalkanoate) depolymerase family esterase
MYEYVPDNLAPNPPILVVVHYCSGNAVGVFIQAQEGGMVALADAHGFIMVLPQTTRNCWDVATTPALTHDGGGDTGAIIHQVQHAIATYGANADRVYMTGTSSGAMVTQVMLAAYPDVFKGGVAFAGVPAGCWSVNNPEGQWSAPCAGGEVTHTAAEWGDMARNMYPGYSGFRPRLQLWHGVTDTTLSPTNQTEAIKQWTNVFGLGATPTSTTPEMIDAGEYTRQQWQDACGNTVLDAWTQTDGPNGGPHGTDANMNGAYSIPFLALDQTDATDPQVAADCVGVSGSTDGSTASTGANAVTTTGGSAGPAADIPSRPSCACDLARSERQAGAFLWVGVLALAFGRRRQRSAPPLCRSVTSG